MSSYGLWLSAAGMQLNEHRQNVLANNMANVHTHGYKHDYALVAQRAVEARENAQNQPFADPLFDALSGGLTVQQSQYNLGQGPLEQTGSPLDLAINGKGFFSVQAGEEVRYTRDGAFTVNPQGELVLAVDGGQWRLLSEDGSPLALEAGGASPDVSGDGTVRQGDTVVGKIGLFKPEDPLQLRKIGRNLFEAQDTEMNQASGSIQTGALEGSNFDMMAGLAQTIEAARAYQFNASMVQLQDNVTGQAISRVGRMQ